MDRHEMRKPDIYYKQPELMEKDLLLFKEQLKAAGFPEKTIDKIRERVGEGDYYGIRADYRTGVNGQQVSGNVYLKRESLERRFELKYFTLGIAESKTRMDSKTFHMGRSYDPTLPEAYNLMQGRAIYKELLERKTNEIKGYWVTLTAKQDWTDCAYLKFSSAAFRAEHAIEKNLLAKLLKPEEKAVLAESLKQGNITPVTVKLRGWDWKVRVEMLPKPGVIRVTDASGAKVKLATLGLKTLEGQLELWQQPKKKDRSMGL